MPGVLECRAGMPGVLFGAFRRSVLAFWRSGFVGAFLRVVLAFQAFQAFFFFSLSVAFRRGVPVAVAFRFVWHVGWRGHRTHGFAEVRPVDTAMRGVVLICVRPTRTGHVCQHIFAWHRLTQLFVWRSGGW